MLTVQSTRGKFARTYGPPESRTCYRCYQPGHLARQCPQKHTTQYRGRHKLRGDQNQKYNANGSAKHAKLLMSMSQEHREEMQTFIVDSGATEHMVNKLQFLTTVRDINAETIELGNGFKVVAHRMGKLLFNEEVKNGKEPVFRTVVFKDVLFIPELTTNLVSRDALFEDGFDFKVGRRGCSGIRDGILTFQAIRLNGNFLLSVHLLPTEPQTLQERRRTSCGISPRPLQLS